MFYRCLGAAVAAASRHCLAWVAVTMYALASTIPIAANAQSQPKHDAPVTPTAETWFGADVRSGSWSLYTGTTTAWGGTLHENGWRLRSIAGYGEFSYTRGQSGTDSFSEHEARSLFADVMPGYQTRIGASTIKLFTGATFVDRNIVPDDPDDVGDLSKFGVKAALETWTNLPHGYALKLNASGSYFFDADISFQQFKLVGGLSRQAGPGLRIGLEAGIATDRNYRAFQFGPTAQVALGRGMFLSAGAGYTISEDDDGAFGRFQFRVQY